MKGIVVGKAQMWDARKYLWSKGWETTEINFNYNYCCAKLYIQERKNFKNVTPYEELIRKPKKVEA